MRGLGFAMGGRSRALVNAFHCRGVSVKVVWSAMICSARVQALSRMKSVIFTPRTLAPARMRFSCGVLARRLMRRLRVCWVVAILNAPVIIVLTMYTSGQCCCQLISYVQHRWPSGQLHLFVVEAKKERAATGRSSTTSWRRLKILEPPAGTNRRPADYETIPRS